MKYLNTLLRNFRPARVLMSVVLAAILVFASSFPALAGNSDSTKGVDQLPQIEAKSLKALDNPAMDPKTIEQRSQGALNEVQSDAADRNKMYRSNDAKLPVVKQAEKTIDKLKNS